MSGQIQWVQSTRPLGKERRVDRAACIESLGRGGERRGNEEIQMRKKVLQPSK